MGYCYCIRANTTVKWILNKHWKKKLSFQYFQPFLLFSFIYFDFLHHLLKEIKEKKNICFLQHFGYQYYIEVKDTANWMLGMHWKVSLNIAHNDLTLNLKKLHSFCTVCLKCKLTVFGILLLHYSKHYSKVDAILVLKELAFISISLTFFIAFDLLWLFASFT